MVQTFIQLDLKRLVKEKNLDEYQHFLNQPGPVNPAEELAFYTELFPELAPNILQEKNHHVVWEN